MGAPLGGDDAAVARVLARLSDDLSPELAARSMGDDLMRWERRFLRLLREYEATVEELKAG